MGGSGISSLKGEEIGDVGGSGISSQRGEETGKYEGGLKWGEDSDVSRQTR